MKLGQKILIVLAAAAWPVLAGCSSSTTAPGPTPEPQRLYVTNDGGSGLVQIFAVPFSAASTPLVSFADGTDVDDIAFDGSGRAYVGNFVSGTGTVDIFTPPFTNTSTPTLSVPTTKPEGIDLDVNGNLYVANRLAGTVSIYNAPLTGASTAAITIATGLSQPVGLKLSGGVLYVADNTHGYVAIYNPPFSNASAPAITVPVAGAWGIGFDTSANLWVADVAGGNVQKFVPPFTNTSTPAITIATGLTAPEYPALDSSGNLYVSNGALIVVYTAPLSNTSAPAFTFPAPAPNGIRFGP